MKIVDLHDKLVPVVELYMQPCNLDNPTYTTDLKNIVGHGKLVHNQDMNCYTKD